MVTPFSVEQMRVAWVPNLDLNRETPVLGIVRRRHPRAHSCGARGSLLGPRLRTAAGRGPRHASQKADAPGIPAGLGGSQPPSGRNSQTLRPPAGATRVEHAAGNAGTRAPPRPRAQTPAARRGGGAAHCLPVARIPGPGARLLGPTGLAQRPLSPACRTALAGTFHLARRRKRL